MNWILLSSFVFAALVILFLFWRLERKQLGLPVVLMVATLCAVACAGRVLFQFIPQVQPVTAVVIIAGLCLGKEAGFLVGALSALVSNLVLGQGPWTPWQMLAWGLIGLLAGMIGRTRWKDRLPVLCVFSFVCGLLFSLIMDIYTVASIGREVTLSMAAAAFGAGLLFNISHGAGNVLFLLLLYRPLAKKLRRIEQKVERNIQE